MSELGAKITQGNGYGDAMERFLETTLGRKEAGVDGKWLTGFAGCEEIERPKD